MKDKHVHILESDKYFLATQHISRIKTVIARMILNGHATFNTKNAAVSKEFALPLKPKGYKLQLNNFNVSQVLTRLFNAMGENYEQINSIVKFKYNGCYKRLHDGELYWMGDDHYDD